VGIIAAAVTGTTALVVGVLTGILCHCVNKYKSQKSKPEHQTFPDEPTINIQLEENVAYGPVNKIKLRENMAYGPIRLQ